MIPVLGVPVLNRADLAARMVRSIDHPVAELVVIVNGPEDDIVPPIREAADANPNVRSVLWSRPGFNLGCGGSWNFIVRARPAGPWWLIVNADITFGAGDLAHIDQHMNDRGGFATLLEYGAFALDTDVIDRVGWFDENYHPMYFEDRDYEHRLHLAGLTETHLHSSTKHDTSSTIRSDTRLWERNQDTYHKNAKWFVAKWGAWPRNDDVTDRPFGRDVEPPVLRSRLADQAW